MRRLFTLILLALPDHACAIDAGGPSNHSEAITVDLPEALHRRNTASKGLGNCVFTSIHHSALYQNIPVMEEFPKWLIEKGIPGGGWPEKVTELIPRLCADRGLPEPSYCQITTGDMEFLRLSLRTGRFPCVTYAGYDEVFYREKIAHMVNLVHLSREWAVILDNNNPGRYLWMKPDEFERRWKDNGGGWAIVFLGPPPPPVPINKRAKLQPRSVAGDPEMYALSLALCLGQCPGGVCPLPQPSYYRPSYAPYLTPAQIVQPVPYQPICATAPIAAQAVSETGWYKIDRDGWLGYWHRGEYAGRVNPLTSEWVQNGSVTPTDLIQGFGLKPVVERSEHLPEPRGVSFGAVDSDVVPMPSEKGEDFTNHGIDVKKIRGAPSYSCNGKICSREFVIQAIAGASLTDDRNKAHLTIVGDDRFRKSVRGWLDSSAALGFWRDRLHVQDYAPDHWDVKRVGLAQGVTFQGPAREDGSAEVLARLTPTTEQELAQALRKADPKYDPAADPDPNKPKPEPKPDNSKPDATPAKPEPNSDRVPRGIWAILGGALLLFLRNRIGVKK